MSGYSGRRVTSYEHLSHATTISAKVFASACHNRHAITVMVRFLRPPFRMVLIELS
jgi:hypothetical protein